MTITKQYITYEGNEVPEIQGAKGGKGGGSVAPNSLFSSDFLFLTTGIGEGPVYRINPNGPQDVQIQDSSIDDLINLDGDGSVDTDNFLLAYATGTITQDPLPIFGEAVVTPQAFASAVVLRSGPPIGDTSNKYSPKNWINNQPTSAYSWDSIRFLFSIDSLLKSDSDGNISGNSVTIEIRIYKSDGFTPIVTKSLTITGKTDKPVRRSYEIVIPKSMQDPNGYKFDVEKTSIDSTDTKKQDNISILGWFEIENMPQAYPRTAVIGYGLKAVNEHVGGVPTFTSMVKGLLVKVPSNYNQPVLSRQPIADLFPVVYTERAGEIDWRELELPDTATFVKIKGTDYDVSYTSRGYSLQKPGAGTTLTAANPQIYVGTWDGSFVYSWTQNPAWIVYDILTNQTYGLGIPEENIDKYQFYKVAQYCDACDPVTGKFIGVSGLADGSYRYKPRGLYTKVRDNQIGLPVGVPIKERRFITDITIIDQEKSMDILNKICSTFRGMLVYSGSKITIAIDMPDEYPVMLFNEASIKQGSFQISGNKQSDIYTGIDVNYIDPTNHFKRETVRINTADSAQGIDTSDIENIASLDLYGVTRRSQAVRMGQYQIAASRYQRRNISFTTSTDAINLAPGDVISISSRSSGVAYGYGGKVSLSSDRNIITYSDQINLWVKVGILSVISDTTAPDNSLTADLVIPDTTSTSVRGISCGFTRTIAAGTKGTWSVYAKAAGYSWIRVQFYSSYAFFNISTGAIGGTSTDVNASVQSVGNGWYRCSITMTLAIPGTGAGIYLQTADNQFSSWAGDGTSGYYFWGAQFEEGQVATTYLKTPLNYANVALEHFTFPALTDTVFTQNTYPLALRILSQASDRLETYIISNTSFSTTSTQNVSNGIDLATVKVLSKFNKTTKTYEDISTTGFTANVAPKAGDLWSLGEIQNPLNYYSDKSNKLFKVTNIKREPNSEEITISGVEYISNIYVDSDTFINYQPTSYTDVMSAFATPPTPDFTITAVPRNKLDGTVVVDGLLKTNTQRYGYAQKFETEYYVSTPVATSLVSNVTSANPLTIRVANATALSLASANSTQSMLVGKNGFTTSIGSIQLLCNSVSTSLGSIALSIEGLSSCLDVNFNQHVLDVVQPLKGSDKVVIPIQVKATTANDPGRNFIGYQSSYIEYAVDTNYTTGTNILNISDSYINNNKLSDLLPPAPFYVTINQQLVPTNYSNNSFYVGGTEYTYIKAGSLNKNAVNYIDLDIKPRDKAFVRFYADGILRNSAIVNTNRASAIPANIVYSSSSSDSTYRVEVDQYTVPTIEVGDSLEISAGNVFIVSNTSYDPASAKYNAALTSNSVYRIDLVSSPSFDITGYRFINISPNPVGKVNNVTSNTFTLDYDKSAYPGNFRLGNSSIYSVEFDSIYSRKFLAEDGNLPELSIGTTSVRARNKNTIGRYSPYVQKSVFVSAIPIQRVDSVTLTESIFIEQTGGASVRVTVDFPVITRQSVTDYEISYKIVVSGDVQNTNAIDLQLQSYNTVKVSANATDADGRIRYTINNVNRGVSSGANTIIVKVTPINRNIRGASIEVSKSIQGKTTPPLNIVNAVAGQQGDIILLSWDYVRSSTGQLYDLDLKDVEIRRLPGVVEVTLDNYLKSEKIANVSPPSTNKSAPIDNYGTYTYFFRSSDTSGNQSASVVGAVLTTIKAQNFTTVAAYNEDNPSEQFSAIPNTNNAETNFPSFANSVNSGLTGINSSKVDNANGSSSGWSAVAGYVTDLKAAGNATYITQIRDFGQEVTGYITLAASYTQEVQSTFNDQHESILDSVSDISLPSYVYFNNVSVAAKELNATDLYFSNTGSYMYVLGTTANANVYQYNLTSAWNVASAVYESNVYIGVRDATPEGLFFRPDGKKMYFVGSTNDRVYEYDLGTAWLANTATHLQNVSIATQDANPKSLTFSNTGSSMYVLGGATNNVYQYTLSTPWNVATASFSARANIAPQDTAAGGFTFNATGTKAYLAGATGDNIYSYTLSQAWNVATMAYSSNLYIGAREGTVTGLYVSNTESSIYFIGTSQDRVQQYNANTPAPNVLVDSDYGGIGYYLGFNNPNKTDGRYDATNKTWIDGSTGGNVWAIWNHGQFVGDVANANTYALIAGLINTNAIALGSSYFANGMPTGGNTLANVTNGGSSYTLVDLKQYSDLGISTYAGDANKVSSQTFIRTALSNVYYASNGNVNTSVFSSTSDGFTTYTAGKRSFRYLQLKYIINNSDVNKYDATLDKFRYTIEKDQTIYTNTFVYSNSVMTIDYSASKFLYVPTLSVNVRTISNGSSNLVTAVFTAISNSSVSIRLANTNGSGYYPADSTATIMLTAQGV